MDGRWLCLCQCPLTGSLSPCVPSSWGMLCCWQALSPPSHCAGGQSSSLWHGTPPSSVVQSCIALVSVITHGQFSSAGYAEGAFFSDGAIGWPALWAWFWWVCSACAAPPMVPVPRSCRAFCWGVWDPTLGDPAPRWPCCQVETEPPPPGIGDPIAWWCLPSWTVCGGGHP